MHGQLGYLESEYLGGKLRFIAQLHGFHTFLNRLTELNPAVVLEGCWRAPRARCKRLRTAVPACKRSRADSDIKLCKFHHHSSIQHFRAPRPERGLPKLLSQPPSLEITDQKPPCGILIGSAMIVPM